MCVGVMRLARTSAIYFLSDVLTSVVGFVATLYFARVLGSSVLGKYFLVVALVGWLSIPSHGVGDAIAKRASERVDQGEILTAGFLLNGLIVALVGGLVVLGGAHVDAYVGADVAVLFAGLFAGQVMFSTVMSALAGQHLVAHSGLLKTVDRVLRVAAQVALVLAGYRVVALVGGELLAVAVSVVVGVLVFRVRFAVPRLAHVRRLLAYARYSWINNVKAKTLGWMDTIVLSLFVAPGVIGIYEISWRLASMLVLLSNAVRKTLFPEMSHRAATGDSDELLDLLDEGLFAAGMFAIPGLVGALVLGQRILRIYGPEFVRGAVVLPILVVALGIDAYGSQFETLVNALDRPDLTFRVNLLFVITNLTLNVALIWAYGFLGAAVATAASSLLLLGFGFYFTVKLVGYPAVPLRDIARQVVAGLAMGVGIVALQALVPWTNMYVTVGTVFAGAGVYFVALYAISGRFRRKTEDLLPDRVAALT